MSTKTRLILLAASIVIALAGIGAIAYAGQSSRLAPEDCPPIETAARSILGVGGMMAFVFGVFCIFALSVDSTEAQTPVRGAEPIGPFTSMPVKRRPHDTCDT